MHSLRWICGDKAQNAIAFPVHADLAVVVDINSSAVASSYSSSTFRIPPHQSSFAPQERTTNTRFVCDECVCLDGASVDCNFQFSLSFLDCLSNFLVFHFDSECFFFSLSSVKIHLTKTEQANLKLLAEISNTESQWNTWRQRRR